MAYPNYYYASSSSTSSSSSPSSCPADGGGDSGGVEGAFSTPIEPASVGLSAFRASSSSTSSSSESCAEDGGGEQQAYSAFPLRYANGEIRQVTPGLKSQGYGLNWGHTLSYSNQLLADSTPGINGFRWFVKELPQLGKDASGNIAVIGIINDAIWFNKSGSVYVARFFSPETLSESGTGSSNEFSFTDAQGQVTKFFGFDAAIPAAKQGQLKSFTDAYGHTHTPTYDGNNRVTVLSMGSSPGISYNYEYYTSGVNSGRLQYVTLKRGTTNVRRISYTYHETGTGNGLTGDLKQALLQEWNGSAWDDVHKNYFRYHTADGGGGIVHGLKFVLGPEACARMAAAGMTDPDAEADATLNNYADHQFEYDDGTNKRVTSEVVNGQGSVNDAGSSSTASRSTYGYTYATSAHADGFNNWKKKTVETRPEGHKLTVYCNYAGQPILKVLEEYSGGSPTGAKWYEYFKYDGQGRVIQRGTSEAVASYSEASPGLVTLNSSVGLIRVYDYYPAQSSSITGEAPGRLRYEKVKQGNTGTEIKVREWQYTTRTAGGKTVYPVWKRIDYRSDSGGGSDPATTTFAQAWFTNTVQMEQQTTTWPTVTTAQHGSNTAESRVERFDEYGRVIWLKDERGFLTRLKYDDASGGLIQRIDDVNVSLISDSPPVPSGWTTPAGGGLHLITDYTVDNLGRPTQELGPQHQISLSGVATNVRRAQWTIYKCASEIRSGSGYFNVGASAYALIEPITLTKLDGSMRPTDIIVTKRDPAVSGPLTATEDLSDQSRWVRWSKNVFVNNQRSPNAQRRYFSIPTIGEGTATDNYSLTVYRFDGMDRPLRTKTPGGTITRLVYSTPGWVKERWVGTDDTGATETNPGGSGAPNNMVKVEAYVYDAGAAAKNGNLTQVTRWENASTTRVSNYGYDFRNRRTSLTGEVNTKEVYTYDNLDRVTQVDRKNGATDVLIGRQTTGYDYRDRVYQRLTYAVNPSTGAVGNSLKDDFWYDPSGNLMLQTAPGTGALNKASYDGVGRVKKRYLSWNVTAPTYASASVVTNDTVMRQEEFTYDAASNVIQQTTRERFHNATGTGELQTPGTEPKARVSYVALYPDALGREQASADYGTNAAAAFSRPATIPARSDTVLVNSTAYNTAGEAYQTTDPKGVVTESTFDHAGRLTRKVEDVGGLARETQYVYNADGRLQTLTAKNSVTGDQLTQYFYGTTLTESAVASNELLRAVIYPDSTDTDPSGTDQVKFEYNRLGEVTKKTLPKHTGEATATVHEYVYDKLGRLLHDRVTAFGVGIDQTVKRITRSYEIRGMLEKISSYDNATVGSGAIVNEAQFAYNDFRLLTVDYQSHSGAVNLGSTPKVQYAYADGSANHTRLTSLTYPDSRVLSPYYGTSGSADDLLSRINAIKQGTTVLAGYNYLGVQLPIRVSYFSEPGVELTYLKQGAEPNGDAGDQYTGLDRFGRLVDQRWLKTSDGTHRERVQYGFDRASNRVWRDNLVGTSNQDEYYLYDNLYQLKTLKRGNLNAGKTDISGTPVWQEDWNYDPTGNWRGTTSAYVTKVNGTTTLNQNRTHDKANAILTLTGTPNWADPTHDAAGNTTKVPQPAAPTSSYDCKYDAWDRLVEVKVTGGAVVSTLRYDGLKRRVTKVAGGNTRHYYYSSRWQVLEERLNALTTADRQFVWGIRHVDDLIERDRGSERFYVLHDHLSVTAIINTTGAAQERYGYDGFGPQRVMDASFGARASSLYDWETGFGAYRLDTESGLYQVRHRSYHPILGRWIARDPAGEHASANLHNIAGNNPINASDRDGNEAVRWPKLPPIEIPWPRLPPIEIPWPRLPPIEIPFPKPKPPPVRPPKQVRCAGYLPFIASTCDGGKPDPYPGLAYQCCQDFMERYKCSAKVQCVANCLQAGEAACQCESSCDKRNECRAKLHVDCYSSCGFIPVRGVPASCIAVGLSGI